ncbi:hypothetical protein BGZ94_004266 [Podila epigama]|nr:hypothetical protein BGZ94_004266 [Podila epigama]
MADTNSTQPLKSIEDYDLGLHVGALFANMAASAVGVLLPVVLTMTTFSPKATQRIQATIQMAKTFGSGVILATAFIHMLPNAFSTLADTSLPWQFQEAQRGYSGWAGLIAMLSAMLLHLLEFSATQRLYRQKNHNEQFNNTLARNERRTAMVYSRSKTRQHDNEEKLEDTHGNLDEHGEGDVGAVSIGKFLEQDPCVHVHGYPVHGGENYLMGDNQDLMMTTAGSGRREGAFRGEDGQAYQSEHHENQARIIRQVSSSALFWCFLFGFNFNEITFVLEFGIALHSVIIGMTLGTLVGAEFISLLVALLFHQFFEGIALGGRIASLTFRREGAWSPWLLSAAFAMSTPLGIGLGIGLHQSYDGGSVTALVVQGILDSLSAGILLYTALVQLMSCELNANKAFRASSTLHQASRFLALWCGAAAMAVIGKWA